MHLRLFEAFIRLYDGQYPLMGNAQVMTAKVAWDNAAYWSVTALLFFQRRFRQLEFMAAIDPLLRRFFVLHARMQQLFNAWGRVDHGTYRDARANVLDVTRLRHLQNSLDDPPMDDAALRERLDRNVAWLESFARSWQAMAAAADPGLGRYVPAAGGTDCADIAPLRLAEIQELGIRNGQDERGIWEGGMCTPFAINAGMSATDRTPQTVWGWTSKQRISPGSWRAGGHRAALDRLVPLIQRELHRIARCHLARGSGRITHAAVLTGAGSLRSAAAGRAGRLAGSRPLFAVASQVMRHVLVDYARQKRCAKRGAAAVHYLREACTGDSGLYREVASLLVEHPDMTGGEAWAAPAAARLIAGPITLEPGHRLGPYQVKAWNALRAWRAILFWFRPSPRPLERSSPIYLIGPPSGPTILRCNFLARGGADRAGGRRNIARAMGGERAPRGDGVGSSACSS